ncbi:MAG: hypothetical protein JW810_11690, partial [Sedimentisphaerales bacterium]|nr:hypothetical protein [Sedimentisphaerales bacterium]
MAKRAFNWKFALLLLLILVGLALSAWGVHQWRRQHIAKQGLKRGLAAFNEQHWDDAAKYLAQYVARYKNDVPNLFMYAEAQMN